MGREGVISDIFEVFFGNSLCRPSDHQQYNKHPSLSENEHWGTQIDNIGMIISKIRSEKKNFLGGVLFSHSPDDIKNVTESMFFELF